MAHKVKVSGTEYSVTGGKTQIDGTQYSIKNGKTSVGGTVYDITFSSGGFDWDTATWAEVYDLCERAKEDSSIHLSDYVTLGATKTFNLPNCLATGAFNNVYPVAAAGPYEWTATVIGIDEDGQGTLTFLINMLFLHGYTSIPGKQYFPISNIYNANFPYDTDLFSEIYSYAKTLTKETGICKAASSIYGTVSTYKRTDESKFWIPSAAELGFDYSTYMYPIMLSNKYCVELPCYTSGNSACYSYFNDSSTRRDRLVAALEGKWEFSSTYSSSNILMLRDSAVSSGTSTWQPPTICPEYHIIYDDTPSTSYYINGYYANELDFVPVCFAI